jgi:hypothetical protein
MVSQKVRKMRYTVIPAQAGMTASCDFIDGCRTQKIGKFCGKGVEKLPERNYNCNKIHCVENIHPLVAMIFH